MLAKKGTKRNYDLKPHAGQLWANNVHIYNAENKSWNVSTQVQGGLRVTAALKAGLLLKLFQTLSEVMDSM